MERLKLETIENIIGVEKITIEAFEKYGECASLDKCILMGMEELKQYRIAEEQGLLLRLPVPCGEWVYSAECGIVAPYIVSSYSNDKHGLWCLNVHGGLIGLWGTSVFKTHKEAEQALAKMKEA